MTSPPDTRPLLRCEFKKNCVLAWPEGCPYWTKWRCPSGGSCGMKDEPAALAGFNRRFGP